MFHPMKSETIARRAKERTERRSRGAQTHRERLAVKVAEEGPNSIWAELLAEHDARACGGGQS